MSASARGGTSASEPGGHGFARRAGLRRRQRRRSGDLDLHGGGAAAAFAKAKPILEAMGKRVVHCGEAGAGQAAKICNNMMLGISMIGVSEAFVLAEKLGLSHQALFDVAIDLVGPMLVADQLLPRGRPVPPSPANNNYKPGFASALMLKDLKLAQEAAAGAGATHAAGRSGGAVVRLAQRLG